jgi:hypothetical protein
MHRQKNQAINFSYEVIPLMFHSQTNDFLDYLERDGLKFLEFWWDYIGNQLPDEQKCSFEGMDYQVNELEQIHTTMVTITLPPPQSDGEVYYLVLLKKPEKHFSWVRLPNTRILALVKRPTEQDPNGTELGDMTPRANYVRIRKGPAPSLENMNRTVLDLIKPRPN